MIQVSFQDGGKIQKEVLGGCVLHQNLRTLHDLLGSDSRESINLKRHMLHAMYLRTQESKVDDVSLLARRSFTYIFTFVMIEVAGSYLIYAPRSGPYCCLCGEVYVSQPVIYSR